MNTWLENFIKQTDLNRYPIALRTEGGIGFQVGREMISNFVGHPVHYTENRQMKPITLDWIPATGEFEGSWFGWDGENVTYCGFVLFKPQSVTFNGVARSLIFFRSGNKLVSDVAGIGTYEIIISEAGCRELLTIPDPIEGELSFQVLQAPGWEEYLYIQPRKMLEYGQAGDVYQLTLDMNYPVVIDPDYSGVTGDGYVNGNNATYATARSTSAASNTAGTSAMIGQFGTSPYTIYRPFMKFDTSGIPDGDTISQVNMKLTYAGGGLPATNFVIKTKKYDWNASDPVGAGNRETVYDGILSATADTDFANTSSFATQGDTITGGNLDTTWVSKTGYTYYGLMSQKDNDNTSPTGDDRFYIGTQDHTTSSYRPILTVAHAGSSATRRTFSLLGVG